MKNYNYAATLINHEANKRTFNFSKRKIISIILPTMISLSLLLSTIFYNKIFEYINDEAPASKPSMEIYLLKHVEKDSLYSDTLKITFK